jgi:hypothetical protein
VSKSKINDRHGKFGCQLRAAWNMIFAKDLEVTLSFSNLTWGVCCFEVSFTLLLCSVDKILVAALDRGLSKKL